MLQILWLSPTKAPRYFLTTVIGNIDTFLKCTVLGTVVTSVILKCNIVITIYCNIEMHILLKHKS